MNDYKHILFNENKAFARNKHIEATFSLMCQICYRKYLKSDSHMRRIALNNTEPVYLMDLEIASMNLYVEYIKIDDTDLNNVDVEIHFKSSVLSLTHKKLFDIAGVLHDSLMGEFIRDVLAAEEEEKEPFKFADIHYLVEAPEEDMMLDACVWRFFGCMNYLGGGDIKLLPDHKTYVYVLLESLGNVSSDWLSGFKKLKGDLQVVAVCGHDYLYKIKDDPLLHECNLLIIKYDRTYIPYPAVMLYEKLDFMLETYSGLTISIEKGSENILYYAEHMNKKAADRVKVF